MGPITNISYLQALFTHNICVCICMKHQEWGLWQQMMLFTLNVCIFKNWIAKIKESANVDVTCECTFIRKSLMGNLGNWISILSNSMTSHIFSNFRPDKLKLHMLKHSSHREFMCHLCGRQFKRKDKLKVRLKQNQRNKLKRN